MELSNLTKDFVRKMSNEEVVMWFSVLQQQQQAKQMREALLQYLDIQEAEADVNVIRLSGAKS